MLQTHNIAWLKFCPLFLNIVKRGKGVETQNWSNSSFSHKFCHWFSEKTWNFLKVVIYISSFWITLKACNYPLCHYDIRLNNFWSPNRQLKHLGKFDKILIFQNFIRQNQITSITKKIPLDSPLYMRLLHQEHKCQIDVIRRRYSETKNYPNSSFSNNFSHWNPNKQKHFSSAFNPKIWITKRCEVLIKTRKTNCFGQPLLKQP